MHSTELGGKIASASAQRPRRAVPAIDVTYAIDRKRAAGAESDNRNDVLEKFSTQAACNPTGDQLRCDDDGKGGMFACIGLGSRRDDGSALTDGGDDAAGVYRGDCRVG